MKLFPVSCKKSLGSLDNCKPQPTLSQITWIPTHRYSNYLRLTVWSFLFIWQRMQAMDLDNGSVEQLNLLPLHITTGDDILYYMKISAYDIVTLCFQTDIWKICIQYSFHNYQIKEIDTFCHPWKAIFPCIQPIVVT